MRFQPVTKIVQAVILPKRCSCGREGVGRRADGRPAEGCALSSISTNAVHPRSIHVGQWTDANLVRAVLDPEVVSYLKRRKQNAEGARMNQVEASRSA